MQAHAKILLAVLAIAGVALALPGPAAAAGGQTCKHAEDEASQVGVGTLRKTVTCLINAERRRHARKPLSRSRSLDTAARKHTEKMVDKDCLAHRCPGEVDLEARIRRAGYFEGADDWRFAENTGCGLTAKSMVANWMASKFHRINILNGKFRDLGIGVSHERVESRCAKGYSTFTAVFGFRAG
jgi:uncharacterized protein YkwD